MVGVIPPDTQELTIEFQPPLLSSAFAPSQTIRVLVTSISQPASAMPDDAFISDISARVRTLESNTSAIRSSLSTVEERIKHIPTRSELYLTALGAFVAITGALTSLCIYLAKPWVEALVAGMGRTVGQ